MESEVSQLKKSLEKLNAQVAHKNQTIQSLQKKSLLFENKIANLENKKRTSKKPLQKIKYKDPESLYKKARHLLLEGNYTDAAKHFSAFINYHQNHNLADNAVYWLGECYYSQGNFQQAIFVFKNLVKKYPKSEKVPDALLKTGYSYLSLDDSNRAHHYLKQVLKRYPFSPASEKAQIKLGEFD
ncbi:MAG: tol-pal system protein YbgF [Desulfobacula sp.]|nr:tol-pal system protein YbgF [Desulfobacula sp.]